MAQERQAPSPRAGSCWLSLVLSSTGFGEKTTKPIIKSKEAWPPTAAADEMGVLEGRTPGDQLLRPDGGSWGGAGSHSASLCGFLLGTEPHLAGSVVGTTVTTKPWCTRELY